MTEILNTPVVFVKIYTRIVTGEKYFQKPSLVEKS